MMNVFTPKLAAACTGDSFLPSLYKGLCQGNQVSVNSLSDIWVVIANLIAILIAVAGALAIIFILIGSIFYVISAGDPSKVKRAKDILTQSITGLILTLIAYSVVTFIAGRFS